MYLPPIVPTITSIRRVTAADTNVRLVKLTSRDPQRPASGRLSVRRVVRAIDERVVLEVRYLDASGASADIVVDYNLSQTDWLLTVGYLIGVANGKLTYGRQGDRA